MAKPRASFGLSDEVGGWYGATAAPLVQLLLLQQLLLDLLVLGQFLLVNLNAVHSDLLPPALPRHRLGLAAPPEAELEVAPPDGGVEQGVQEQVGRAALTEHPHHQELKLAEWQTAALEEERCHGNVCLDVSSGGNAANPPVLS